MASISRWFVGSSSTRRSEGATSARAKATRRCSPPLMTWTRSPVRWPRPSRSRTAAASHESPTASRAVTSSNTGRWGSVATCTPPSLRTMPLSGVMSPVAIPRRVDLPAPLWPTTPSRSPELTVSETLDSTSPRAWRNVTSCTSIRITAACHR